MVNLKSLLVKIGDNVLQVGAVRIIKINFDMKNETELLQECKLQLEYLNEKFGETGTTNALLTKIDAVLRQPDVIKSVCEHRNYRAGHSPFVPCICNDCGEEL